MAAQAASAGYQYSDAPPSATGGPPSQSNLSAGSSPTSGVAGKGHSGSAGGAKNGGSASNGSSGKNGGGNGTGETDSGQGSPGKGGNGSPVAGEKLSGTAPGSDSGGSSPLVPILIAIVLLAGGSVAYLMVKRRRAAGKAPGGPADTSPEAS